MIWLAIAGALFLLWLILVFLFTPGIGYHVRARVPLHSPAFVNTHGRMLVVDDEWAVVGTTNVDNRSFEHNDEVNLALCDARLAARLRSDHEHDVAASEEVTLERWLQRPGWEKMLGPVVWILERQQ